MNKREREITKINHWSWILTNLLLAFEPKRWWHNLSLCKHICQVWKRVWILEARFENGYGKWHVLVWNGVRIWRAGRHTPNMNSEEYPLLPPPPPPPRAHDLRKTKTCKVKSYIFDRYGKRKTARLASMHGCIPQTCRQSENLFTGLRPRRVWSKKTHFFIRFWSVTYTVFLIWYLYR